MLFTECPSLHVSARLILGEYIRLELEYLGIWLKPSIRHQAGLETTLAQEFLCIPTPLDRDLRKK